MYERISFNPYNGYWFSGFLVKELLDKTGCFKITLDLGISWKEVCIENNKIMINNETIDLRDIIPKHEDQVVFYTRNNIFIVEKRVLNGYYKLKAIGIDKAPTLEINGIHMHRITDLDPWSDARLKVKKLNIKHGDKVLDTCLGLGYTAINILLQGASQVYSIEIDENVIWIAEHNPWSRELSNPKINLFKGDVTRIISIFEDNMFDKILHDPPRYSGSTGELYSLMFYKELYRVLKPGGKLYHYTGEPGRYKKASIVKGIGERLRKAGFYPVLYDKNTRGYIAYKQDY